MILRELIPQDEHLTFRQLLIEQGGRYRLVEACTCGYIYDRKYESFQKLLVDRFGCRACEKGRSRNVNGALVIYQKDGKSYQLSLDLGDERVGSAVIHVEEVST